MTTVNNPAAMSEKDTIQPVFSEELDNSVSLGSLHEKNANTPPKQCVRVPSVKDLEAKVARMASKPGLRSKIDANCLWCTYDPLDMGSWRQQVERCEVTNCPLFSARPRSWGKK